MNYKMFVLSIWNVLDPIGHAARQLTYVDREGSNIFRVKLICFKGQEMALQDGSLIKKNDLLLKIHLDNLSLLKELIPLSSDFKKGKVLVKWIERSLPSVYRYVLTHDKTADIKGIIGLTMLYPGSHHLGFETLDVSNRLYRDFKWLSFMPIHFLSVSHPLKSCRKNMPKYLYMSMEQLAKRYGD
ncbi:YkoP family protein [Paenibacillus aquistagni]|uniref:YkoP family protein n=1 Tax=Paenibacillus aquistagni TaxID=1852522 RepID=UPI0021669638|nr:hypothetical protein [Paenibacillus aquistagni]